MLIPIAIRLADSPATNRSKHSRSRAVRDCFTYTAAGLPRSLEIRDQRYLVRQRIQRPSLPGSTISGGSACDGAFNLTLVQREDFRPLSRHHCRFLGGVRLRLKRQKLAPTHEIPLARGGVAYGGTVRNLDADVTPLSPIICHSRFRNGRCEFSAMSRGRLAIDSTATAGPAIPCQPRQRDFFGPPGCAMICPCRSFRRGHKR